MPKVSKITMLNNHSKSRIQPKNFYWLLIAILIILFDQLSKFFVAQNLLLGETVKVTAFFNLYYTYNTGAAFSFLASANGWQEWLLGILAFVVSLAIVYWLIYAAKGRALTKFALMLILGGALGNLIDRLIFGQVRDFLDFHWQNIHFATFNIADSAICIGALLLIVQIFRRDRAS